MQTESESSGDGYEDDDDDALIGFDDGLPARVDGDEAQALCDYLLDPERLRPVVLVAPWTNGAPGPLGAHAYVLAEAVQALADVVILTGTESTWVVTDQLGRDLSAFNGAVRIVMPRPADAGVVNWLFRADSLIPMSRSEMVETILHRVKIAVQHVERGGDVPAPVRPKRPVAPRTGPRTVSEALESAAAACPNLVVLDSARRSAEDSPYRYPERVQDTLMRLAAAAEDVFTTPGLEWHGAMEARGLRNAYRAHISATAESHWGDEYVFEWKNQPQVFRHHLTIGAGMGQDGCFSVHFLPDPEDSLVVLGHVGAHLTNTRTS